MGCGKSIHGYNMFDSPSLQIVNEQCFNHLIYANLYLSLRATLSDI